MSTTKPATAPPDHELPPPRVLTDAIASLAEALAAVTESTIEAAAYADVPSVLEVAKLLADVQQSFDLMQRAADRLWGWMRPRQARRPAAGNDAPAGR
jgi:hypothetical protein